MSQWKGPDEGPFVINTTLNYNKIDYIYRLDP